MLRTVSDLLAAVQLLPPTARAEAHARIDAALEGDARTCRAALGMLALDLVPAAAAAAATAPADARDLEVRVHVVDLDALPARATA
ncbi:hypothetical protein [Nitriliruptor alkaliphilus]|uniref:hypothetical protein n=1 Tax=Nitriliruptor alkaliphilus TaxID=427918 RepID=UPI0006963395|nr:hypothetical protein [Nitriliruptor alkaliphilus]